MRIRLLDIFLGSLFVLMLIGCSDYAVFDQYQYINKTQWNKNETYYFTFQIEDAAAPYEVSVNVRNNNKYPFQNLWLFVDFEPPFGEMQHDTIECMLANDYGKWLGRGISIFETNYILRKNFYFPIPGEYTFSFRQGMRANSIIGIEELGLHIDRSRGFIAPATNTDSMRNGK